MSIRPNPENAKAYDAAFELFNDAYDVLAPLYKKDERPPGRRARILNYTLHKDIPVPLYYQLKLQILADIQRGAPARSGDMLPPECELCQAAGRQPARRCARPWASWSPRAI